MKTLKEQLKEGGISIFQDADLSQKEDIARIVNEVDGELLEIEGSECCYHFRDSEWFCGSNNLPKVHVNEFLKEERLNISLSANEAQVASSTIIDNLQNQLDEAKERAEKLEAQLKELQPYPRGAEGWVKNHSSDNKFAKTKAEYIAYWGGKHVVWMHFEHGKIRLVDDFTTDNPHKKETVFVEGEEFCHNYSIKSAIVVYLYSDLLVYICEGGLNCAEYQQIGDDLQAKFDDPINAKYINLIK